MHRALLLSFAFLLAACGVDRSGLGTPGDASTGTDVGLGPDAPTPDLGPDAPAPDLGPDMPIDMGTDMPDLGPCGPSCVAPMLCCGTSCVDPRTDPTHCGGCSPCPTPAHGHSTCASSMCGLMCDPGFDDCDLMISTGCEANLTSVATCGSCALTCLAGPHATPACGPSGCTSTCDLGFADCTSAAGCETDTTSDAMNCGTCGHACGPGRTCAASACSTGWVPTTATGAPAARTDHSAVWTGTKMIVWGGDDVTGASLNTGGIYDPATDSWTATSMTGVPNGRRGHVAVWTGTEMLIWGGYQAGSGWLGDGGAYNPTTNTWRGLPTALEPSARSRIPSVWSGTQMLVWGGWDGTAAEVVNTGAKYTAAGDAWSNVGVPGRPSARRWQSSVWDGSAMIVWSGENAVGTVAPDGALYDPVADAWSAMSAAGAPSARARAAFVWTGSLFLVWGGDAGDTNGYFDTVVRNTGGAYDPVADAWVALGATTLVGRSRPTAVWTGSQMLVWGGRGADASVVGPAVYLGDGAAYDPAADAWTPMLSAAAPSVRWSHTAVWTGSEMIVWGGWDGAPLGDGGRYAP